ncbi:outer membrane biogenesis protein BamB [Polystyrenella longa]|uniref:Outer membrane biogenesis protein BamB n=1 Tax=Polystyrenella longa TaxID=2528007 RepID=A0A518CQE4_9PLAN|nr:PQQ-binding-like beta-propeller repeat protein [Polystyrenella longa]QDU81441.1 outer membrane biogenesis protein BamB [Polystyrenella longa]
MKLLLIRVLVLSVSILSFLILAISKTPAAEPARYPLSDDLQTLADDLDNEGYQEIVSNMIRNDLEEEWKRVATADNYIRFREQQGGLEKINQDPELKAAYEQRKEIAERYLKMMEDAYAALKKPSKVLQGAELEQFLAEPPAMANQLKADKSTTITPYLVVDEAELGETWPQFRGPTGQGKVLQNQVPLQWGPDKNVVWKQTVEGTGHSSPVIWKDDLFLTRSSEDGLSRELLCYDVHTGDLRWQRKVPEPETTERLYWKNSYASSTPVTDGERVVVFMGNSGLTSFSVDGTQEWHQPFEPFETIHGPAASPIIYKDLVILVQDQNKGDSLFVAYNKQTGDLVWRQPREQNPGWASPTLFNVNGKVELVHNGSHFVRGYDPATGAELWQLAGPSREAVPNLITGQNALYSVSGRNGPILAFLPGGKGDVTETHLLWKNKRGGPHVPSPAYHDGRLYIATDTGILRCLDASTGKSLWQERLSGKFSASPLIVGDLLYFTNEMGKTYIFRSGEKFDPVETNDLEEYMLASAAVAHNRIYFRTQTTLYCIGQP